MDLIPTRIEPANDYEMLVEWNSGEKFLLPYNEFRFRCPCASCVNETTGKRTLQKESISKTIKPKKIGIVGRYGIKVNWNDQHSKGMYHFDSLFKFCKTFGKVISNAQN